MKNDKQIKFYATEVEKENYKTLANSYNMTLTDLIKSLLDERIQDTNISFKVGALEKAAWAHGMRVCRESGHPMASLFVSDWVLDEISNRVLNFNEFASRNNIEEMTEDEFMSALNQFHAKKKNTWRMDQHELNEFTVIEKKDA